VVTNLAVIIHRSRYGLVLGMVFSASCNIPNIYFNALLMWLFYNICQIPEY